MNNKDPKMCYIHKEINAEYVCKGKDGKCNRPICSLCRYSVKDSTRYLSLCPECYYSFVKARYWGLIISIVLGFICAIVGVIESKLIGTLLLFFAPYNFRLFKYWFKGINPVSEGIGLFLVIVNSVFPIYTIVQMYNEFKTLPFEYKIVNSISLESTYSYLTTGKYSHIDCEKLNKLFDENGEIKDNNKDGANAILFLTGVLVIIVAVYYIIIEPNKTNANESKYNEQIYKTMADSNTEKNDVYLDDNISNVNISDINIEGEVLAIRSEYNDTMEGIENGYISEGDSDNKVVSYFDGCVLRAIFVRKSDYSDEYERRFYYLDNGLYFADFEGRDAHRFYFKDGRLIRWRYASEASKPNNAVNHDLSDEVEYKEWERKVKEEGRFYLDNVLNNEIIARVLLIREEYNDTVNKIDSGQFRELRLDNGIVAYLDGDAVRAVYVYNGFNDIAYGRHYYYQNNELYFAYYGGEDAHRFYYEDNNMIRWRYSPNSSKPFESINFDLGTSDEYRAWEGVVKNEGNMLIDMIIK